MQMTADRAHALQEATRAVARAIELDGTDALGYALRGRIALLSEQHERYPAALDDARRAHELNPNDPFVLRILANLEAATGEGERAIDHLHQALRLSPLQSRRHHLYLVLAFASFISKRYSEGVGWALRALNDMPTFSPVHVILVICLVGTGEIHKAKAAFAAGQRLSPAYFRSRLDGKTIAARQEDRRRYLIFLRVAAGLEDPSAADALR
jgi:adenylate cyclase